MTPSVNVFVFVSFGKRAKREMLSIVKVADAFEPLAKWELVWRQSISSSKVDALSRGLRRQAIFDELLDDGIRFQIENRSVFTFDLQGLLPAGPIKAWPCLLVFNQNARSFCKAFELRVENCRTRNTGIWYGVSFGSGFIGICL